MWASIHCGALKSTIGEMALNSLRGEAESGNTADNVAVFIFLNLALSVATGRRYSCFECTLPQEDVELSRYAGSSSPANKGVVPLNTI